MENKYILCIDLGTSGPKVSLVNMQGEVLMHEFESTPISFLPNGGAEQKPSDWWNAVKSAAKRLIARHLVPAQDIVAISATSQWSTTVAVDKNGRPLMNAVSWMDTRGAKYIEKITDGLIKIQGYNVVKLLSWLNLTGGAPAHSGKDSIAHILFIKNELPDIYRDTYKFLEPKDYLNLELTGKFASSYDVSLLLWATDNRDPNHIHYDKKLLGMIGVDVNKLPDMKQSIDILGTIEPEVAAELGLSKDVKVVVGTGDTQSAAIGSGAVNDYDAHLYLGTSSWLSCFVPKKGTDIDHNMAAVPSAIPGRYSVLNEQESAGSAVLHLRDNLIFPDDDLATGKAPENALIIFDQIAERVPAGSDRVIFAPWLYGERTPIEDSTVRGGFFNVSLSTKREHFIRAVLEGVAYNSRWLLQGVEQFTHHRFEAINMIGGGAQADIWCQIMADVLDRPIRQMKDPIRANSRGAAYVAIVGLGLMTFDDIHKTVAVNHVFEPNPANRAIYDELFAEFLNLYKNNKSMYARLNRHHGNE
ncbi:MAG: FGGY-family carbohydrate kinase [Anaerolineales bacterium]